MSTVPFCLRRPGRPDLVGSVDDTGEGPVGLFVHGFRSDCAGAKAAALAAHARARGRSWVRFDLSGHGGSGGIFHEQRLSTWLDDVVAVAQRFAPRPLLLVGSSLGAWLAVLLALRTALPVQGLVLLAPAFNFLQRRYATLPEAVRTQWQTQGQLVVADTYAEPGATYVLAHGLIEEAAAYDVLSTAVTLACPVIVIHGAADALVPVTVSEVFMAQLVAPRKELIIVPDGDHRLTTAVPTILAAVDALWERSA